MIVKILLFVCGLSISCATLAKDNLDPQLLLGTWTEEHNSKTENSAEEYSQKILTCTKAGTEINCEGSSLYKAAGQPLAATNSGLITGKVQVAHGVRPNSPLKNDHLFIKDQDSEDANNTIAIEVINSNKIKIHQYKGASLGGLNVVFDGIYSKQTN